MELTIKETIRGSAGRDLILGDLNGRHHTWDTMTNVRGRAIMRATMGNMYRIRAPEVPTYSPRGREGSSNPDIMITNVQRSSIRAMEGGSWTGLRIKCHLSARLGNRLNREGYQKGGGGCPRWP